MELLICCAILLVTVVLVFLSARHSLRTMDENAGRAMKQISAHLSTRFDAVLALLRQYGLPVDCAYPVEQMLGTILHDKKASGGSINLIVPTAVGSCEIRKTPASEISDWLRAGGAK